MGQLIKIMDKEIMPIVCRDQRVLTMNMVDDLHERNPNTARKRFNENRERFVEGQDFFELPYDEWSNLVVRFPADQHGGHRGNMNVLTESGYLLLVKSFNDDLAWQVQRALVCSYFMVEQAMNSEAYAEYQMLLTELAAGRLVEVQPDEMICKKDEFIQLQRQVITGLTAYPLPTLKRADRKEEEQIIKLVNQGMGPTEIGHEVGRKVNGVTSIVKRLRKEGKL